MTPEKVKEAFDACRREVRLSVDAERADPTRCYTYAPPILKHVCWMCIEGKKLVDEGRIEKAMRWLGFVQGVLFARGLVSIEQLKNTNKPEGT